MIAQLPHENTRVYAHVGDLDVSASYPNGEASLNTSLETTIREPMEIVGIEQDTWRMENMGISSGHVNAMSWSQNILNFPTHEQILVAFVQDTGIPPRVSFEQALLLQHGPEFAPMFSVPQGLERQPELLVA